MTSFMERLRQEISEIAERDADPLRGIVETTVRGMQAISTHALLDLIGLPITSDNARRIALTMRSLGFVPLKSRQFEPGGWKSTVTRGWARPVKAQKPLTPAAAHSMTAAREAGL